MRFWGRSNRLISINHPWGTKSRLGAPPWSQPGRSVRIVLLSPFYVALVRLLGLVALRTRSESDKDLEILVLRHELAS